MLNPWTTPQLSNFSCSLFNDILTSPPFNIQHECLLIDISKIVNIYIHVDKGILEGVIRWGYDILEDGSIKLLCGIGYTKEVCHSGKDIIIRAPSLDDTGCPFGRIGLYRIFLTHIVFSYYHPQYGTDTLLLQSCKYLMKILVSVCIHNTNLECW